MPSYKPVQDSANAAKKIAVPKSPKRVVPKLGSMPKAPKSSYGKSPKAGPVGPKIGRPLPAAGSGRKVALNKITPRKKAY
jgi:hypothetical protein